MKKIIILDRDGVINYDALGYIRSPDDWVAIPGSLEAIADLNRAGYHVVVATNQSGVGRGYYDIAMLDTIHEKLMHELAEVGGHIDEIFFCPHHPSENCDCRKPKPGLLTRIQKKYEANMTEVYFIGDKLSDVQAARAVGCKPLLVLAEMSDNPELAGIPYFPNLAQAAQYVLAQSCHSL
ncbi:MAG: D-glycero-beta-D-manno-heptose 1,7-bisphosphate 7-phosphatase [Gammaproteobacteria bacterium]